MNTLLQRLHLASITKRLGLGGLPCVRHPQDEGGACMDDLDDKIVQLARNLCPSKGSADDFMALFECNEGSSPWPALLLCVLPNIEDLEWVLNGPEIHSTVKILDEATERKGDFIVSQF